MARVCAVRTENTTTQNSETSARLAFKNHVVLFFIAIPPLQSA